MSLKTNLENDSFDNCPKFCKHLRFDKKCTDKKLKIFENFFVSLPIASGRMKVISRCDIGDVFAYKLCQCKWLLKQF